MERMMRPTGFEPMTFRSRGRGSGYAQVSPVRRCPLPSGFKSLFSHGYSTPRNQLRCSAFCSVSEFFRRSAWQQGVKVRISLAPPIGGSPRLLLKKPSARRDSNSRRTDLRSGTQRDRLVVNSFLDNGLGTSQKHLRGVSERIASTLPVEISRSENRYSVTWTLWKKPRR